MLLPTVLLGLLASAHAAPTTSTAADSNYTFFSVDGFTSQKWVDAYYKAKSVAESMTLAEKLNWTAFNADNHGCSAYLNPIPRFNISSWCLTDGPSGNRGPNQKYSTQFPPQLTTAATWNRDLIYSRAQAVAKEFFDSGVHVPLSIIAGPLGRTVWSGRNWEGSSPDAWLTSEVMRLTVEGYQSQGGVANIKHFYGNEQERLRQGVISGFDGQNQEHTLSAVIDAATARETYMWPFADAIRSGAGSAMCAYTKVNGTLSCESSDVINKELKQELNLGGWVISDWSAIYDGVAGALAGVDSLQTDKTAWAFWGDGLGQAIEEGKVPEKVLTDKLHRALTPYFALEQHNIPTTDTHRWVSTAASRNVSRKVAEEAITLVKNVRTKYGKVTSGLPLNNLQDLALIGSAAAPAPWGINSNLNYLLYDRPVKSWPGLITDGFGSGGKPTAYATSPLEAITARAWEEERPILVDGYYSDDPFTGTAGVPGQENTSYMDVTLTSSGAAIVFVATTALESYDRASLFVDNGGDALVRCVADRHNNTIVNVVAPGQVDMSAWIDHPNVTAVLFSYFPGPEAGSAIARVLFGDVSPSGKLPWTVARATADYPDTYYNGSTTDENPTTVYSEGNFIDYKWWDAQTDKEPLYEFGHGLSYTNFSFSDLKVSQTTKANKALVRETNEKFFPTNKLSSGLYDIAFTVEATVKNTGSVAAAEVAQLYLSFPDSTPRQMPVRSLRGFKKAFLQAGESKTVSFELRNKDLAYYDVVSAGWKVPEGEFTVSVGSSSRKLPLTGKMTV
ncbi:hypothetical protein JCM10207_004702 [Rhodosporidiobolus poonsookiae]